MISVDNVTTEERSKLLKHLRDNIDLKKAESALGKLLGPFTLRLIDSREAARDAELKEKLCKVSKANVERAISCIGASRKAMERAKSTGLVEAFVCPAQTGYGFCCALKDDGSTFAYMIGCRLKNIPAKVHLDLFGYFIETILKSVKKEIQLEELYETVKPRILALSTVHTLHRLISTSPYLNDLLTRVARLSMQIIKAQRCSVKLVDSRRKTLLPKTTVDVRRKKTKLKKVKIGKWAPGKAVKYGRSICGESYLATPLIDEEVIGVITLYDKVDKKPFNNFDIEIMETLAEQAAVAIKNARLYKDQESLTMGSIKALAQIIESRSAGICAPKSSFLKIVLLMGEEFQLSEYELKILQYASLLHDAGELVLPEEILRKRGKLTPKEYRLIKEHPLKGAGIIKSLKSLKPVLPIIMYHHENYDGTGYPKGLRGNEIPLGARIMAVVSAFEAMIVKRPYRKSYSTARAIEEVRKNSGRQFDPTVVRAFLKIVKRKDVLSLLRKEAK